VLGRKVVPDRLEVADEVIERGEFADVDEVLDASGHGLIALRRLDLARLGGSASLRRKAVPGNAGTAV
jgi:hypothetical protein